jgi:hypothetical protein
LPHDIFKRATERKPMVLENKKRAWTNRPKKKKKNMHACIHASIYFALCVPAARVAWCSFLHRLSLLNVPPLSTSSPSLNRTTKGACHAFLHRWHSRVGYFSWTMSHGLRYWQPSKVKDQGPPSHFSLFRPHLFWCSSIRWHKQGTLRDAK